VQTDTLLLVIVVVTALGFDFTNGFHDTANAVATSIATRALRPKAAVVLCGVLNFAGAFLSLKVAATIASGIVNTSVITLTVVFAGLVGAIIWNLVTWFFGIPSSSSHAIVGGIIGAALIADGTGAIQGHSVVAKVIIPAVLAPCVAGLVALLGTFAAYRITRDVDDEVRQRGFRIGQIGSASLLSLAHGTNDAQKTMGIITLALIAHGTLGHGANPPLWVIASAALAMALGSAVGGWRVIRTLGHGLFHVEPAQGFAADASSTSVILSSAFFGYPLSTTHVVSGSVIGAGMGKRLAGVRWAVAGRMVSAWLVTIPAAAAVGAVAWGVADIVGGRAGALIVFAGLLAVAGTLSVLAKRRPVTAENVNDDWASELQPVAPRLPVPA